MNEEFRDAFLTFEDNSRGWSLFANITLESCL